MPSELETVVTTYVESARRELRLRVESWKIDLGNRNEYAVSAALAGRQVSLATQLARAPSAWNEHAAPLFLRAMIDVIITLKWILLDPKKRANLFLAHGLGQAKLTKEHRKDNNGNDPAVDALEDWISQFKIEDFVEVNVGSWSGIDTRTMAEEVGERDLHRLCYAPFSSCVHSTFDHIGRFNLVRSANPLHQFVPVPVDPEIPTTPHYVWVAAKYLQKTWDALDAGLTKASPSPSAFEALSSALDAMGGDPPTPAGAGASGGEK